ncbi:hypothetical protein [Saccharolobus islandicus]
MASAGLTILLLTSLIRLFKKRKL